MSRLLAALTTTLLACASALPGSALAAKKTYFRVGNAADAAAATTAGTVLMGGSTDVDAAFEWLCDRATGGDFLVVRATGTDAYNPYVQALCPGFNSVATLIISSAKAANVPAVRETIANAEVVWIAADARGVGKVVGTDSAYFIEAPGAPEVCSPGLPLTYRNVAVRRVGAGESFNVADWRGNAGTTYTVTAEAGVLSSSQPGGQRLLGVRG